MGRWKENTVANYVGTAWSGAARIISLPLYIRFLGIEAFGLVGFYMAIQAVLSGADFGLAPTLSRVLAKWDAKPEEFNSVHGVLFALERIGLIISLALGLGVAFAAPYITVDWLNIGHLSRTYVERAIILMGAVGAFRWMTNLYRGGLLGLQKQVQLNVLQSAFATLRWLGVVIPLMLWTPALLTFFWYQALIGVVELAAYRISLLRYIPKGLENTASGLSALEGHGKFAGAMSAMSVLGLVLAQMDKVVLSKILSLTEFGYYSVAASIGTVFAMAAAPILNSSYPRLTELVALGEASGVLQFYHRATKLMSFMVIPAAVTFAFFAPAIISVWTGNKSIAAHTGLLATILVLAAAVHGITYMPYALQMAFGWVRPSMIGAIVSVAIGLPAMLLFVPIYGSEAAALIWLAVNLAALVVVVPIVHYRLLSGEVWSWYMQDIMPSVIASGLIAMGCRFYVIREASTSVGIISVITEVIGTFVMTAGVAALVNSVCREFIRRSWKALCSKVRG